MIFVLLPAAICYSIKGKPKPKHNPDANVNSRDSGRIQDYRF